MAISSQMASESLILVIRTTLYKCRWVISSGRLDNLVKCAVWRGSNKLRGGNKQ